MNAIPHREREEVAAELAGIWKQEKKEDALLNFAAFKAKYRLRYPEAIRSLCEHARTSFDVLCLSTGHASLHS
jgi:putative transposase